MNTHVFSDVRKLALEEQSNDKRAERWLKVSTLSSNLYTWT